MSKNINIFCPDCGSVLNISKTNISSKQSQNINLLSNDDDIDNIIKKASMEEEDNIFLPENFNLETFLNNKNFIKLPDNKKKLIMGKIEKNLAIDNSSLLFYSCKSCSWTQKIPPGTKLLTKVSNSEKNSSQYSNLEKYKNKIHSNILPLTRNYICPNKSCPSATDFNKREAVIFRENNNSMKVLYICKACTEIFESS